MRAHDVLDAVRGVGERDASVDAPALGGSVEHQQADAAADGVDSRRQLVVAAPLRAGVVVHRHDPIALGQPAALGRRARRHLHTANELRR